jgi:hypothetical protein
MFRMSWMVKRAPISGVRAWLSQAVSSQIDAIGIVDDAVEDRVGERRDSNHIVPAVDRNLAGDDERAFVVTVLDDFEEIAGLFRREGFRPPIVVCGRPLMARTILALRTIWTAAIVCPAFRRGSYFRWP